MPTAAWWGFVGPPAVLPFLKDFLPSSSHTADTTALPSAQLSRSSDKVTARFPIHSPLKALFLLFATTAQHPQHCWDRNLLQEQPGSTSSSWWIPGAAAQCGICTLWDIDGPLRKVLCLLSSVVVQSFSCVKNKNEVSVLATTNFFF